MEAAGNEARCAIGHQFMFFFGDGPLAANKVTVIYSWNNENNNENDCVGHGIIGTHKHAHAQLAQPGPSLVKNTRIYLFGSFSVL